MRSRIVLELSGLPMSGARHASPSWWGTLAFMLIEGTGFALSVGIYLYLASLAPAWPGLPPPDLLPGTALSALLLATLLPNWMLSRATDAQDLRRVRLWLMVMLACSAGPLLLRIWEFRALHVRWDDGAYGSIVWFLLGLHTTHLLSDFAETAVLTALMFTRHAGNPRRFGDVKDEVAYWVFVVLTWLPIYACLYWAPRL